MWGDGKHAITCGSFCGVARGTAHVAAGRNALSSAGIAGGALSQQGCLLRGHRYTQECTGHVGTRSGDSVCDDSRASMSVHGYLCSSMCKLRGKHRRGCVCVCIRLKPQWFSCPLH